MHVRQGRHVLEGAELGAEIEASTLHDRRSKAKGGAPGGTCGAGLAVANSS